ncbi:MAG: insulinase family protein [Bacteroidota bacterium]|nr:insulinase family protein [Bacteroidota bacterium]
MRKFSSVLISLFIFSFLFTPYLFSQDLPVDKNVTIGTLGNGMKYYIRKNAKPEKRAELRLVVNAGSVLENDDQKGLAHFVEHMGFNGTKHFSKSELVDYLELIGVKMGAELNASTNFDQTIFQLQVPTDKSEILSKAFLVLEDWAHGYLFDSTEIEKERGVIVEEWRLGRGADMRMLDKQLPILFKNSKYADRITIGDKHIIETFKQSTLKDFYKDWYRPDLMAVVAVGDFDKVQIEALIKEHFGSITSPALERKRELFPVPKHDETLFAIASDKEATNSSVSIYIKLDKQTTKTEDDFRRNLSQSLLQNMLNQRLSELTLQSDPPFTFAFGGRSGFVRTADCNVLFAQVKDNGIEKGLSAILREAERARLFGFTSTELERTKSNFMRGMEKALAEKDKTESGRLINEYVYSFLDGGPIMGIENLYDLYKKYLPKITLTEVNKYSEELLQKSNRVVMVNVPEKEGVKIPTEAELTAVMANVSKEKITAYVDNVSTKPLLKETPKAGTIVSSTKNEKMGYSDWKLSNGVRVVIKPTDFKNDEILFAAFSKGGSSLIADENYISASQAPMLAQGSGLGEFSQIELRKYLTGKIAGVSTYIGSYEEGLRGSASPKDVETMFQLIYANFTHPRIDSLGFNAYKAKMISILQNANNSPETAFKDTLYSTLSNYHFRMRPWTIKTLDEVNMDKALAAIKDRFADASDFTFVFAGNIDTVSVKPLILKYLGGLPSLNRNENWKDLKITNPDGIVEKVVKKGIEPKSSVAIVFNGPYEWNRKNEYKLESLIDVVNIRLREAIREDKGGTYGVGARQNISHIPTSKYSITVGFGCNPDRAEELTKAVFSVIDSIKNFGTNAETLAKVKETQKRQREVNIKLNSFWLGILSNFLQNGDDPSILPEYNSWVDELKMSDIKEACAKYFDKNYVKVVLYPEDKVQ